MGLRTKTKRLLKQILFKDGTHKSQNRFQSNPRPTSADAQQATPPAANRPLRESKPTNSPPPKASQQESMKSDESVLNDEERPKASQQEEIKSEESVLNDGVQPKADEPEAISLEKTDADIVEEALDLPSDDDPTQTEEIVKESVQAKSEPSNKEKSEPPENANDNGFDSSKPFEFLTQNTTEQPIADIHIKRLFPDKCPNCNVDTQSNWGYREGEYYCTACDSELN